VPRIGRGFRSQRAVKVLSTPDCSGIKKNPTGLYRKPQVIHETPGLVGLTLRQLPNLKLPEVIRQSDKLMRFQKSIILLRAFIPSGMPLDRAEYFSRGRLGSAMEGSGERFERTITRQLGRPSISTAQLQRQEQDMFKVKV